MNSGSQKPEIAPAAMDTSMGASVPQPMVVFANVPGAFQEAVHLPVPPWEAVVVAVAEASEAEEGVVVEEEALARSCASSSCPHKGAGLEKAAGFLMDSLL